MNDSEIIYISKYMHIKLGGKSTKMNVKLNRQVNENDMMKTTNKLEEILRYDAKKAWTSGKSELQPKPFFNQKWDIMRGKTSFYSNLCISRTRFVVQTEIFFIYETRFFQSCLPRIEKCLNISHQRRKTWQFRFAFFRTVYMHMIKLRWNNLRACVSSFFHVWP